MTRAKGACSSYELKISEKNSSDVRHRNCLLLKTAPELRVSPPLLRHLSRVLLKKRTKKGEGGGAGPTASRASGAVGTQGRNHDLGSKSKVGY